MTEPTLCCRGASAGGRAYCLNCDLLVDLDGLHVVRVDRDDGEALVVTVESASEPVGCPTCGVLAHSHGRRVVELVDIPFFGCPARIRWLKRRWICPEPACATGTFTEQDERLARPRALLTQRACWWAVRQLRREHASVAGIARQLGTSWRTVWRSVVPLLEAMAADESRLRRGAHPWRRRARRAPRGAVVSDGGERPPSPRCRSDVVKLAAARPEERRVRAGAAATKSGRPSTAGWAGSGERDGKVYARNRCRKTS